jgi:hypothetical protein
VDRVWGTAVVQTVVQRDVDEGEDGRENLRKNRRAMWCDAAHAVEKGTVRVQSRKLSNAA